MTFLGRKDILGNRARVFRALGLRFQIEWFNMLYSNRLAWFGPKRNGFLFGFNLWKLVVRVSTW